MRWYDLPSLLPPVYANIKSMHATADTENTELLSVKASIKEILDNFFIQTCDEETLSEWERIIGIELYGDETIETRRQMVLLYLANNWQITAPYVKQQMLDLFGVGNYEFEYDPQNHLHVYLRIINASTNAIRRFTNWFCKVCPAHIKWGAVHTETSEAINEIPANTTGHFGVSSSCTMAMGSETLYLGENSYSINWVEL